jgi:hypothetical protein
MHPEARIGTVVARRPECIRGCTTDGGGGMSQESRERGGRRPGVEARPCGIQLPDLPNLKPGWRLGRCPLEGYQRGWGLEFGDLREQVEADPLYKEAAEIGADRSLLGGTKRHNLFLLLRFFLNPLAFGHIIEFGVHRGGNVLFMAHVARVLRPGVRIYALDTFSGMPETDAAVDAHSAGDFEDADLAGLRERASEAGLENIVFCEGLFEDTAPGALRDAGAIALAHIDCDIRSAVAYGYEVVRPFMVPGGYIVFDDATVSSCLGATEAVEELVIGRDGLRSEQIHPHFVFRAPGYR